MNHYRTRKKIFSAIIMLILAVSLLLPCFADSVPVLPPEATATMNSLITRLSDFYNLATKVSLPIATVAISAYGLSGLLGGQKEIEKAIAGIKWIAFAYVILVFLPTFLDFLIGTFKAFEWNPMTFGS